MEVLLGSLCFLVMLYCMADDDNLSPFWALLWLFVFGFGFLMAAVGFWAMWGVALTWVITNPASLLWYILGYLAGGVIWATVKWLLLNHSKRREYTTNLAAWQAEYLGQSGYSTFQRFVEARHDVPPSLDRYRYRMLAYMAWWPINIVTTVFNFKKLFDMLYRWMSNFWGQVQHMVWHDVDFSDPKKVEKEVSGASST